MRLDEILERFKDVSKCGTHSYMCKCSAHRDDKASLSIKDIGDRILVYCHAGCDTQSVLENVGLELKDLFKENRMTHLNWQDKIKTWKDKKKGPLKLEELYSYYNDNNNIIYYKARYEQKEIRHFRVVNNEIIWKDIFQGIEKTLYNKSAIGKALEKVSLSIMLKVKKMCIH